MHGCHETHLFPSRVEESKGMVLAKAHSHAMLEKCGFGHPHVVHVRLGVLGFGSHGNCTTGVGNHTVPRLNVRSSQLKLQRMQSLHLLIFKQNFQNKLG